MFSLSNLANFNSAITVFPTLVPNIDCIGTLSANELRVLRTSWSYFDVERRSMFGELRDRHGVDRLPRYLFEIEAVEQTGYCDPDVHLADFPPNTDPAPWMRCQYPPLSHNETGSLPGPNAQWPFSAFSSLPSKNLSGQNRSGSSYSSGLSAIAQAFQVKTVPAGNE